MLEHYLLQDVPWLNQINDYSEKNMNLLKTIWNQYFIKYSIKILKHVIWPPCTCICIHNNHERQVIESPWQTTNISRYKYFSLNYICIKTSMKFLILWLFSRNSCCWKWYKSHHFNRICVQCWIRCLTKNNSIECDFGRHAVFVRPCRNRHF